MREKGVILLKIGGLLIFADFSGFYLKNTCSVAMDMKSG
jgi:hypothetical protein